MAVEKTEKTVATITERISAGEIPPPYPLDGRQRRTSPHRVFTGDNARPRTGERLLFPFTSAG